MSWRWTGFLTNSHRVARMNRHMERFHASKEAEAERSWLLLVGRFEPMAALTHMTSDNVHYTDEVSRLQWRILLNQLCMHTDGTSGDTAHRSGSLPTQFAAIAGH